MSLDWNAITAFALALPDTELSTSYGKPAIKIVSNGRAFLHPSREPDSFVLAIDHDTKEMLMETDPDTFWQTPHYANYPMLLVRYGTDARERIELYIQRAWWDRAKKPQRVAAGMAERP